MVTGVKKESTKNLIEVLFSEEGDTLEFPLWVDWVVVVGIAAQGESLFGLDVSNFVDLLSISDNV